MTMEEVSERTGAAMVAALADVVVDQAAAAEEARTLTGTRRRCHVVDRADAPHEPPARRAATSRRSPT